MTRSALAASAALLTLSLALTATGATAAALVTDPDAQAVLHDRDGNSVGMAQFEQGPGALLVSVELENMPEGWHALHIHQTGDCSGAGFKSSGGHLGVDSAHHGFLAEGGPHPGDLPNIYVDAEGRAEEQDATSFAHLRGEGPATVLDADGAAVVIHMNPDDYQTDPAGRGGDRIACGVIDQM